MSDTPQAEGKAISPSDLKPEMYVSIECREARRTARVIKITPTQIVCRGISGIGETRFRKSCRYQAANAFPCYEIGESRWRTERITGVASKDEANAERAREAEREEWRRRSAVAKELEGAIGGACKVTPHSGDVELYTAEIRGLTEQQVRAIAKARGEA